MAGTGGAAGATGGGGGITGGDTCGATGSVRSTAGSRWAMTLMTGSAGGSSTIVSTGASSTD